VGEAEALGASGKAEALRADGEHTTLGAFSLLLAPGIEIGYRCKQLLN